MPRCTRSLKNFLQWNFVMCTFTFLDTLSGDGILPQLVLALVCDTKADGNQTTTWLFSSPECNNSSKETVTEATSWYNSIVRDNNIAAMLMVTLLMATSDVVGRKRVMVLALLGLSLDRLAIALSPSLFIIHCVHTAAGLVFSRTLFYCVTFSTIADLSTHKTRSKDFSWLEASMSLGMIVGPYGGGLLVRHFGLKTPFYVTCVGSIVLLVFVLAVLTESTSADQRTTIVCGCHGISEYCLIPPVISQETEQLISRDKASSSLPQHAQQSQTNWIRLTPFGSILILFQSLPWLALTSMVFFDGLGHGGYTFIISLYTKYQFNWGAYETGIYFSVRHIVATIGNGPVSRLLPLDDQARVMLAGTWGILYFGSISYYTTSWMMYTFVFFEMLSTVGTPTLRGTASKLSSNKKHGSTLGAVAMLNISMSSLGSVVFSPLFEWLIGIDLASFVFTGCALCFAAQAFLAACVYPTKPANPFGHRDTAISERSSDLDHGIQ